MNDVVKRVLEIEYRAKLISDEAHHEQDYLPSLIKDETEELEKNIMTSVNIKLRDFRKNEIAHAKKEAQKILETAQKKSDAMQSDFTDNREAWVQCIFTDIMGR